MEMLGANLMTSVCSYEGTQKGKLLEKRKYGYRVLYS